MEKYSPNLSHKSVQKAIKRAMLFALNHLHTEKPKEISRDELNEHIGYSHHNLGRWLREMLLIDHSQCWDIETGRCKEWLLNEQGFNKLYNLMFEHKMFKETTIKYLDKKIQLNYALAKEKFGDEIAEGNFVYKEQTDRFWNPIQNIRTVVREQLMFDYDYKHNYDIECAMASLLVQYARKKGLGPRTQTKYIDEYIKDRTYFRQKLATEIGCTMKEAKKVIAARFGGSTMILYKSIYKEFADKKCYYKLVKNEWFKKFSRDISKCWKAVAKSKGVKSLSNEEKMHEYFMLEKKVISAIEQFIKKDKTNKYFKEHDGWRCVYPLDINFLTSYVKSQTGFEISVSYEQVMDKEITMKTPLKTAIINRGYTKEQADDIVSYYQKLSMMQTLKDDKNPYKVFYKDELTPTDETFLDRWVTYYKIKFLTNTVEPPAVEQLNMVDINIYHVQGIPTGYMFQGIVNNFLVHFFSPTKDYEKGTYTLYSANVFECVEDMYTKKNVLHLKRVKIAKSENDIDYFKQVDAIAAELKEIKKQIVAEKEKEKQEKAAKKAAMTPAERMKKSRAKKKMITAEELGLC